MKKFIVFILSLFVSTSSSAQESIFDIKINDINGSPINLNSFKGKYIMFVNVASKCGFTPQYSGLQKLHTRYKEEGLIVLGVPSNDFNQELSKDSDVKEFCEIRFGVDFPMTSIQKIRGDDAHPLYKWISSQVSVIAQPRWNFHKYLVDPDGQLANWFSTPTSPLSSKVIQAIETNLP